MGAEQVTSITFSRCLAALGSTQPACGKASREGDAGRTVMGLGAGADSASRSFATTAGSVPGPCKNLQLRPTTRSLPKHAQHG